MHWGAGSDVAPWVSGEAPSGPGGYLCWQFGQCWLGRPTGQAPLRPGVAENDAAILHLFKQAVQETVAGLLHLPRSQARKLHCV